mgnify:CR=1 FL=1
MSGRNPEELAEIVIGALNRSNQRGVLLTGWGGKAGLALPPAAIGARAYPRPAPEMPEK